MKSNHISIAKAAITTFHVILAGEEPFNAFLTCFRMRRITNMLFDLGMTPEDLQEALSINPEELPL
jgi:hypothetical protein